MDKKSRDTVIACVVVIVSFLVGGAIKGSASRHRRLEQQYLREQWVATGGNLSQKDMVRLVRAGGRIGLKP